MKTQLLQDIGESQPSSRTLPIRDSGRPGSRQAKAPPSPEQRIEPELPRSGSDAGFSDGNSSAFGETDWPGKQREKEPHWFDRWGRRAATWSACLAAGVIVAGGAAWLYNENQVESTLAVLAKNALPARQAAPVPAPQLKVAPPDPIMQATAPLPETTVSPAPPDAPVSQHRARIKAPVKAASAGVVPALTRAETLRQCRIAGYHAEQCMQRKCAMTRYGLACKG